MAVRCAVDVDGGLRYWGVELRREGRLVGVWVGGIGEMDEMWDSYGRFGTGLELGGFIYLAFDVGERRRGGYVDAEMEVRY